MLSSKKPKKKCVTHRILQPSPQWVAMQPDKLNNFFASTAERTIGARKSNSWFNQWQRTKLGTGSRV